jgi:hypothetical protein
MTAALCRDFLNWTDRQSLPASACRVPRQRDEHLPLRRAKVVSASRFGETGTKNTKESLGFRDVIVIRPRIIHFFPVRFPMKQRKKG